jgi:Fic family protein
MVFIREKTKGITTYYELVESVRINGKVRQKVLKYFGDKKEMLEYSKKHSIPLPKSEGDIIDSNSCKKIEKELAALNSLRPLSKTVINNLNKKFEVEMTYNSNAIEGNRLSLRETYFILEKGITIGGKPMKDYLEATNHRDAILLLEKIAKKNNEVLEIDVLNLHAIILDKIDPFNAGFYRHEQIYITGTKHIPPNWREVPDKMKFVIKELNSTDKGCAAIESAARLHHLITWIHPFVDGNGRLARLLTNLRLMRAGFPPIVLQKKIRLTYYSALEKADEKDLRPLAMLILRDVDRALDLWLHAAK